MKDDLISRQAVLDAINDCGICIQKILDLPSAQPEQKTGKWIKCGYWSEGVGMGEIYGRYYKCSECGIEVPGGDEQCGFNYCHSCGAKMVVNDE